MSAKEFSLLQIRFEELLLETICERLSHQKEKMGEGETELGRAFDEGYSQAIQDLVDIIDTHIEGERSRHWLTYRS
jgi:hypothetical protein